jgi:hypothetical protein
MVNFTVILDREPKREIQISDDPVSGIRRSLGRLRIDAMSLQIPQGIIHLDHYSFVVLYGRAHWKTNFQQQLSSADLATILQAHRTKDDPQLGQLAGNFCLLSYDELAETMWIGCDFWGTAAPYYGSGSEYFVAASRAGMVAQKISASIDGISYLALMREATIPSGRTLFDGVRRLTAGHALRLDGRTGRADIVSLGALYREPINCTLSESVERSTRVIMSAVALAASAPGTMVDLTAGNDTRLTAAALAIRPDLGRNVRFRVTGEPHDPDVIAARSISAIMGWKLERCSKYIPFDSTMAGLLGVAAAGDGFSSLLGTGSRIELERQCRAQAGTLVGSTCGELFRNWIWQPELHRMGQTRQVNFDALMQHRIRRNRDTEVQRLSNNAMSIEDHDRQLLQPYRDLAGMFPEALNTYKLELMYIQQLQNRIVWWPLVSLLTVQMPYLWSDVTDVSLRLPWRHKLTRRLVTTIVESIAPEISAIPTDRGAPFKTLRLSTVKDYARYLRLYTSDIIRRHYLTRGAPIALSTSQRPDDTILSEWADIISGCALHNDHGLIASVRDGHRALQKSQRVEFLTMLNVELLLRVYPQIRRRLVFN